MNRHTSNLMRDLGVIMISILVAVLLAKTGALTNVLTQTQELKFLGSFLAGIFFISVFTAAPAGVALFEIAQSGSIGYVAFFGGLGGLVGDLVIFRFIKDNVAKDFLYLIHKVKSKKFRAIFRLRLFQWLIPFIGALIVASPFPDELGLVLIGLSHVTMKVFVPLSFTLNFLGILALAIVAQL